MKKIILILIILFQIYLMTSAQVNLQEGLYAHYSFNGNLNDKSGSGYDLIAKGGNFSTGRFGNISAYQFNGTSDYLISDSLFTFNLGTISFWVNMNEFPTNNLNQRCFFLGIDGWIFGINCLKDSVDIGDWENWNITNSNYKLQLNKWYHIVAIRSQEHYYLYINDTLNSYGIDPHPDSPWTGLLNVGILRENGGTYFFNGKIDDVRIYNRALNDQEIHSLYTLPKEVDPLIINGPKISICSNESIVLRANYDSTYTYQWLKDETAISGANSDTLVITKPGEYRIKETDSFGNNDISSPTIVSNFTVFVKDTTIVCGSIAQLKAYTNYSGNESLIYLWSPSNGLNSADIANPVADIINTKKYSVTVTTLGGCSATDSLRVIVEPLIAYAHDTTIRCGTDAQLNVTTNYNGNKELFYNWTPSRYLNDPHIRNPIAIKPRSTIYSVEVSTFNGCVAEKNITLNLSNDLKPYAYAYYPFNGNINDQSGNHFDLTASGGKYSTDRFGSTSAYEFNGTTDYLFGNNLFEFFSISSASVSFWFNMHEFPSNNPNQECVILGLGGAENSRPGFGILSHKDTIVIAENNGNRNVTNSSYKLQLDKWYHVVVTLNETTTYISPVTQCIYYESTIRLYINDTLKSECIRYSQYCWGPSPSHSGNSFNSSGYLQLGSMIYSDSTARTSFFNGKIDDVMFYNKTLSPEEINNLYMDKTYSGLHPSICMVSVNDSDRNFVVWQTYHNSGIDSTFLYRESSTQTDQYDLIGRVPYTMGIFIDSSSNAAIRSNKYKISYKDICGYESEKSLEHKTMHLTMNKGIGFDWNLIWEPYTGIPVGSYNIYRGTSKSDLTFIGSVSGSSSNYTDVDAPSGIVYYQVKIDVPQECLNLNPPEVANSGSNIVSTSDSEETNKVLDDAIFYPNPADNVIYIRRCNSTKAIISIFSLDGKLLLSKQLTNDGNSMDISALSPGIYLVKLVDSGVSTRKKLIKR